MYRPRWRIIVVFVKAASSRRSKEEESIKVVEEVKLFHKKNVVWLNVAYIITLSCYHERVCVCVKDKVMIKKGNDI